MKWYAMFLKDLLWTTFIFTPSTSASNLFFMLFADDRFLYLHYSNLTILDKRVNEELEKIKL